MKGEGKRRDSLGEGRRIEKRERVLRYRWREG